jgi:hypothetical protein
MHEALNAHKVEVTGRIERGIQDANDSHAQNIGWKAVEYCAQKLHDWKPNQEGAHAFWLKGVQSLTRGERVGKMKPSMYRLGKGGDHILGGKGLTSKRDKLGRRSYDKRYVPNFKKPHMCLLTALGTLLLCRPRGPWNFLFMSDEEAKKYERKVQTHAKRDKRGKATRSRAFGPHVQFDKIIARTFNSASIEEKNEIGISTTKNVTGHSKKNGGYQQVLDIENIDIVHVATRAEHNTGNFGVYGARSIKGVEDSGGPNARVDILMAKALAGRQQYTSDFNSDPPHWDKSLVKRLVELLPDVIPCYPDMDIDFQLCVPLLIAQVIYHYHVTPIGMSEYHPLFQTSLWTTHQSLRQQLFEALRGGDTGQASALSSEYCDKDTEVYLWQKATHELAVNSSLQIKEVAKVLQEALKCSQICLQRIIALEEKVSKVVQGVPDADGVLVQGFELGRGLGDDERANEVQRGDKEQPYYDDPLPDQNLDVPLSVPQPREIQRGTDNVSQKLLNAGKALNIEDGINVETAWHVWHGSGQHHALKDIQSTSVLLPSDPDKKRSTLQLISKIGKVVEFVQGITSDADVKKDITFAWNRCKESLCAIIGYWPFHGSVRYAYDQTNGLRKSLGLTLFNSCRQRLVCVKAPILRQAEITNFFDQAGQILTVDEDADVGVPLCQGAAVPPAECLECPICPQHMGDSADLVVFKNSDSLWQHWKARHANEVRPALFKIHRVLGMKLLSNRTASWIRVPHAMSYRHTDYRLLKMREDIVLGFIKLTPGMLIEIEPESEAKSNGERWFASVRDGRVMNGEFIMAQFCHTNCLELAFEDPQKLTIANILQLGPFKDVPLKRRQLTASPSASRKECNTPVRKDSARQLPALPIVSPIKIDSPVPREGTPRPLPASPAVSRNQCSTPGRKEALDNEILIFEEVRDSIQSQISGKMLNKALAQFHNATRKVHDQGWTRCTKIENGNRNHNLQHNDYDVSVVLRDGHCLYHCFSNILYKRNPDGARKNAKIIRETLARYIKNQVPPEGQDTGKYGGILKHDENADVWLPCEESLSTSFGGEMAIFAFVYNFHIPLEIHSPENGSILRYHCDGRISKNSECMEMLLQTNSWMNWSKADGERLWSGDHWQNMSHKKVVVQSVVTRQKVRNVDALHPDVRSKLIFEDDAENASKAKLSFLESIEVQIILRAVRNNSQFLCNPDTVGRRGDELYPTIKIKTSNFVVHNYGDRFDRIYHSHIQKIFLAFPQLNEENRSFFLALGIGAGLDPFLLQCLFRKQAERLLQRQNKSLPTSQIKQLLHAGGMVENVLSWCWPTMFDETSIFIVDDKHNVKLFETQICTSKTIILMRNYEGQYLLLQPLQETTCLRIVANTMPFLHATNSDLRCPCMSDLSNYEVFQSEAVFIAAELPGSECPTAEFDTIWLRSIEACGLEYDSQLHKWTKFPDSSGLQKKKESKNVHETDGSLRDFSWDRLRSKMVAAFLVQSSSCCPEQQQLVSQTSVRSCARLNLASPTRTHGPTRDHAIHIPCLFLDAGSEAGKGLYKMMQDDQISHVAGVEFQKPWFHISTQIFRSIRQQFSERNYRMPHVTLVHSCMLAQTSTLKWLYSSASLVWMNNFVFDKSEYFNSSDPTSTRHPSKSLVPGNKYLTPNAAFNLSQHFDGTTLIAVFDPTKFLSTWNYTPFKPLKVHTTWSTTREETVTILRHSQHFHISQWYMCFPTSHEAALWDSCTAEWSKVASPITTSHHIPCASISCLHSIDFKCGNTLNWNLLHRLTNRRWLCSDVILAYALLLGKHYTNIHFEFPGLKTDFSANRKLRRFREKRISIFCYNISDVHWIAIKFDRDQEHITLCDSLAMKHDAIFKDLQILASKLGHSTPFKQIIKKVPNQENSFDCGPLSCLFMLLLAQDNSATDVPNDWQYNSKAVARLYRTRIFADIINQKLTTMHITKS